MPDTDVFQDRSDARASVGTDGDDWDDPPPPTKPVRHKGRVDELASDRQPRDSWGDVSEPKQVASTAHVSGGHAPAATVCALGVGVDNEKEAAAVGVASPRVAHT